MSSIYARSVVGYYIASIIIVVILYNIIIQILLYSALLPFTKQILDYVVGNEGIVDFSVKQFIVGHINAQAKDDRVLETISIEKQTAIYYYSGYLYSLDSNSCVLCCFVCVSIDEEQYTYLCSIKMKHAFCVVKLLSGWMGSGLYEFCDLPHSMKAELKGTVSEEIHFRIKKCGPGLDMSFSAVLN